MHTLIKKFAFNVFNRFLAISAQTHNFNDKNKLTLL